MAKKHTSIRIDEELIDYIESRSGKDFGDKFHSLLYWIKDSEVDYQQRLNALQADIDTKRSELRDVKDKTVKRMQVYRLLDELTRFTNVIQDDTLQPHPDDPDVLHKM